MKWKRLPKRKGCAVSITKNSDYDSREGLFMKKLLFSVLLGMGLAMLISHCGMNSNVFSLHRRVGDELEIAERMF